MINTNQKSLVRFIILLVIIWRALITLVSLCAIKFLEFQPTFSHSAEVLSLYGSRWLTTWAHFDGVHYLTIADKGYVGTGLIQAFFPLYPLLIRLMSLDGLLNPVMVGIILSTTCLIAAMVMLSKLLLLEGEKDITIRWTLLLNLSFVTAFFYTSVYGESLFLLLTVSCFYFLKQKRWWLAGIMGGLAAFTKVTGVFLALAILYEYWQSKKKFDVQALSCALPMVGLGLFMMYLQYNFGDPFLFAHVQSQFGAGRETGKLILLYQVVYRYIKMMLTVPLQSWVYYQVMLGFGAAIFGMVGLVISYLKIRRTYFWYVLPAFLLPTLTGTFSSLPRYVLVLFPFFWALVKIRSSYFKWFIFIVFVILQVINLMLFTQGKWVA